MLFGNEFHMMSQEGFLARTSLLAGLEFLKKADYDKPGDFYAVFFQLSIGLERMMKIAFILNHKACNGLENPPGKTVRELGHNLRTAYALCRTIAIDHGSEASEWYVEGTSEHMMLSHLCDFARGARYYNLDAFSEKRPFKDPMAQWYEVHKQIADQYISFARQEKINRRAIAHCDKHQMFGWERSITGEYRTAVDCTFLHELFKQANGYCVWTVIRLVKPFYALLSRLCEKVRDVERAKGIDTYTVPDMDEFFPFFLCDRETSIRRTKWIGIY